MKSLFIFLITLLSILPVVAQDYEKDESSYMEYEGIPSKEFSALYGKSSNSRTSGKSYQSSGRNVIKAGLLEVIQGRPTLYYERVLTKGIGLEVGLGVNFRPAWGLSNNGNLRHTYVPVEFSNGDIEDISVLGIYGDQYTMKRNLGFQYYVTPRFYFSGNAPKGFYFSAGIAQSFANFTRSNVDVYDYQYGGNQYDFTEKTEKSKEFGIGAGLGSQFAASSVVFDFNIMFYYNSLTQERYNFVQEESYTLKGKSFQLLYSVKIGGLWGKKSKG